MNYEKGLKKLIRNPRAEIVNQNITRVSRNAVKNIPVYVAKTTPTHSSMVSFSTGNSLSMSSPNFGLGFSSFKNTVVNLMNGLIVKY